MGKDRDARVNFLLDSFLESHKCDSDQLQQDGAAQQDYVSSYLESVSDDSMPAVDKAICSRAEELLNAFLNGGSESIKLDPDSAPQAPDCESDEFDETPQTPVCTETMAYIYLKQRRYDKALAIIRSLYLNFPNKSIYFADQIRYLELLVRINQK